MAEQQWVPTIDDLRVKLCYICREEERYDGPEDPPRVWTHPCSCTLVAHETCLLDWIKSAQQDSARAKNALKCPQCGATYELESDNPRVLRILNSINASLSAAGKVATIFGLAGLTASFGFTLYVVSTSYGAFAVREFLGKEMYDVLLGDDPAKWPWHAYIHLPVIPFSLILSRTRLFDTFPLVPLFVTWSSSPPVRLASPLWSYIPSHASSTLPGGPALGWPPSPLMGMILFPFVRMAYRRAMDRLTKYVMGPHHAADTNPFRRFVFALNDDGPAPLRVRIAANVRPGAAAPAPAQQGDAALAGLPPLPPPGEDAPADPAADAERTLLVSTSSLGRYVGGALLIPAISARMGALLLWLSRRSAWLRAFLAVGVHGAGAAPRGVGPPPLRLFASPSGTAPTLKDFGQGLAAGFSILCGGTPTWNAHEPVWWRNTVGLGLFVFAKDCARLVHLWLTKRELESRRVKSRDFAGIDIRELDLINAPLQPETNGSDAPAEAPATASA